MSEDQAAVTNRFICHNCGTEFQRGDFSDELWSRFCSLPCCYAYFRRLMPKARPAPPFVGEKSGSSESEVANRGEEDAATINH